MYSDQEQFDADMRRRIRENEKQLKKLSDDELMRLHESIDYGPEGQQDAALMAAALREVDRRRWAAGWFWRRWFRPGEYRKWVDHMNATETKAAQQMIDIFEKYDDPTSQESVRRLQQYGEDKEAQSE